MFRNRAYLGERIYNTTRRTDQKSIRLKNPEEDIVRTLNAHPAIISQEIFDKVQQVLRSKQPRRGQLKYTKRDYILSGLLWCGEHNCLYTGHTNGQNAYYACAERKKTTKTDIPCSYLKKEEFEQQVLDSLREKVFTRERIKAGLEWLVKEGSLNQKEDNTERDRLLKQIKQVDIELERLYKVIAAGADAEALAKPINERMEQKRQLQKTLVEIARNKELEIKLPQITDDIVTEVQKKVQAVLDQTDRRELKTALARFIERIEITGDDEFRIDYTFEPNQNVVQYWRPRSIVGSKLQSLSISLPLLDKVFPRKWRIRR
jgi:hypothetical protein